MPCPSTLLRGTLGTQAEAGRGSCLLSAVKEVGVTQSPTKSRTRSLSPCSFSLSVLKGLRPQHRQLCPGLPRGQGSGLCLQLTGAQGRV